MSKDFLSTIINKKKARLKEAKAVLSQAKLKQKIKQLSYSHRPFKDSLVKHSGLSLIAEIKKASPSKGLLCKDFNPVAIANIYQEAKADALSVLTEEDYFLGNPSYIKKIRQSVDLSILRKDFIIDEYQIYESYLLGADAILLIATLLSEDTLKNFLHCAKKIGLECLLEVHNKEDLKKTLSTDAKIIGINNRNLHTFELDLNTAEKLTPLIPKEKLVVSESGIKTKEDIMRLKNLGINSILMGEAFISSRDIKAKVKEVKEWLR